MMPVNASVNKPAQPRSARNKISKCQKRNALEIKKSKKCILIFEYFLFFNEKPDDIADIGLLQTSF